MSCKSEVADLEFLAITDQQVLWFDVSVQHVEGVHIGQSLQ